MNYRNLILLVYILFGFTANSVAQRTNGDNTVKIYYEQALAYMEEGDYSKANLAFRKALSTNKVLPTDLSYHFAETLYQLGQYQNSLNFVEKYLSLTDSGDDFYEEAVLLRNELLGEFNAIKECMFCNVFGYRYVTCEECDEDGNLVSACNSCKGNGLTICRKCYGKGVLVSVDAFLQEKFAECDRCEGHGYEECAVCRGEMQIFQVCNYCLGTKQRTSTIICDHTAPEGEHTHSNDTVPYKKFE